MYDDDDARDLRIAEERADHASQVVTHGGHREGRTPPCNDHARPPGRGGGQGVITHHDCARWAGMPFRQFVHRDGELCSHSRKTLGGFVAGSSAGGIGPR